VPQLNIPEVGRVDFAVFVPQISTQEPLLVVECDGHNFHERTTEQVSRDNRRDRAMQRLGIPFLRFTATDIVRNSEDVAREIMEFVHIKLHDNATREAELAELMSSSWNDGYKDGYQHGFLLG
jgi:very-short-patch-repair endonuclease